MALCIPLHPNLLKTAMMQIMKLKMIILEVSHSNIWMSVLGSDENAIQLFAVDHLLIITEE
jgi:hypothetical protein